MIFNTDKILRWSCTRIAVVLAASALSGCGQHANDDENTGTQVETSGKEATAQASIPPAVMAAALASKPQLQVLEVEYEQRDGREYYDVGGILPDGSEIELDMTQVDGSWTVVEIQRDLQLSQIPQAIRTELFDKMPGWTPERIIESDQGNGVIIYEFFTDQGKDEMVKKEIKWENDLAEMLLNEWEH